eukprot:scaffold566_cov364-Pavlova_lutheri.AAC.19
MAGRAVQRALASRESHALRDEEVGRGSTSDTCSEELEDDAKPSRRGNAFDLLLGEGDGEDADADGTDSSDGQEAKVEARKVVPPQKEPKKKKKKKQKKKEKEGSGRNKASEGDELDRILKDLQIVTKEQEEEEGGRRGKTDSDPTTPLLGTDNRQLSVEAEMKRIFGAKVVQEGIAEDERNKRMPKGRRRILRKGTIITPKEHWNKFEGGLSMEYLGLEDGRKVFEYKYSVAYQDVQNQYDSLSNTHDPNTLVALLQYHPYHVDTLLTVSELYQHMGEAQVAGELLEKALYALECAWHPYFKPAEGNCRLNFSHEPNKPFFLALFRFAQNLSRRGCHRTSLQCAKLLLALDDDDPLGVLQAIDYYALRAREYRWLLRLSEEYLDGQCTLSLYPNFAFSLSLAKHRIELEAGSSESAGDASDEMLLQAVMLHPAAVKMLIEKLQEKGVARESKWQEVLGRALFKEARHDSASLEHLSRIFVERQHLMWKPEEILSWLRKTADLAANIEEGKEKSSFCAGDWQVVCAEFFPPSSVNSYQHLHLGDFSDNRALLPQEDQGAGIFGMGEQAAGNNQPAGAFPMEMLDREDLEEGSPLLMLLRTLLPWVHVGDEEDSPRDPPGPRNGQAGE